MQKNQILSVVLVIVILLSGVVFWAYGRGVVYIKDGSLGFSKDAITNPVPSLDRGVTFPQDFGEEAKAIYTSNVEKLKATLATDPQNFEAWLDLAIYYRMVGDHEGAVEVWEYLRKLYKEDGISRRNLGQYYFYEVKDYPKAETYYRESIAVSPGLASNYTDLYDMYRYVYKQDTDAAVKILEEGINIGGPIAIQFNITLGRHYRDVLADKENARKYLTEARDAAQAAGDRKVATDLTREISALQ